MPPKGFHQRNVKRPITNGKVWLFNINEKGKIEDSPMDITPLQYSDDLNKWNDLNKTIQKNNKMLTELNKTLKDIKKDIGLRR